jgi:hypothetical protein
MSAEDAERLRNTILDVLALVRRYDERLIDSISADNLAPAERAEAARHTGVLERLTGEGLGYSAYRRQ